MLFQSKLTGKVSKFDRAMLDAPITYRVVFSKIGNLQYFSHLDLQRTWQRVLVRASIPMWYTQGFNPHAKIVFGVPLPVGSEGLEEMVDLRVDRAISPAEMKAQLNAELTDEMQVAEVYVPTTSFSDIAWATYEITLSGGETVLTTETAAAVNALFAPSGEPLMMSKRSKSGDKDIDILPLIYALKATVDCHGLLHIRATLRAGNTENLGAEYLIKAMRERLGLLPDEDTAAWYRILRLGFHSEAGVLGGIWFR